MMGRSLGALLIILLGFAIYSNSFDAGFQFDDKEFVVHNRLIRDTDGIKALIQHRSYFPRFLSYLSFAANYRFHQLDVFGYHLVNITIHILNAFLVWWFVVLTLNSPKLSESENLKHKNIFALLAALIFLSHPLQTEAVTYISQRFTSLATLFYLLSLCCYINWRRGRGAAYVYCALVSALAAMLSKQISFTLPFMIIIYELYFHEGDFKKLFKNPLFLAVLASFVIFIPMLYRFNLGILSSDVASRSHEGDYLFWLTYGLTQFRVLVTYIRLLFVPLGQNLDYDYAVSTSFFDERTFFSFLLLIALIITAIKIYPRHKLLSFCIAWFFLSLIVESSIIVIPHVIFEHRLYLPMVGFCLGVAVLISQIMPNKKIAFSILVLIIGIYSVLTYQRNFVWKDGISMWSDIIKKSPKKSRPYHNRGYHYLAKWEYKRALDDFNRALELNPKYLQAYSNRAAAYRALGQHNLAMADYNKAISLQPRDPQAYHNRAHLYAALGKFDNALADYKSAIEFNKDYFLAYYNRGSLYTKLGKYDLAMADLTKCIEINPQFPYSYAERGKVFLHKRKNKEAIADLSRTIELDPKNSKAYNNRGIIYSRLKQYTDAMADFNKTIALDADNGAAYFNRSLIHLAQKDVKNALKDAQMAEKMGFSLEKEYLQTLQSLHKTAPLDIIR